MAYLQRIAEQAQRRLAERQARREQTAELIGQGEAADGLVRVGCTARDPLAELTIHPRAMRLPSEDLAAAIRQAAALAATDLRGRTAEITRSLVDEDDDPAGIVGDPAAAQARLDQLTELATGSAADISAVVERFTAQFRR